MSGVERLNDELRNQWSRDGVRAWFVCAASFYVYVISWGIPGTFPMLLPQLVDLYKLKLNHSNSVRMPTVFIYASNSSSNGTIFPFSNPNDIITTPISQNSDDNYIHAKVSLICSLNFSLVNFMCIIAPFIINRIGCLLTMIVGIFLSLVGTVLPSLFPDASLWIWWLGFGLAGGTGYAIMYISSSVVLEQYFDRHFGLASGIQSLGSSITMIVLPFLWQYLINTGPTVSRSAPDSLAALASGLSLTMYSCVLMCALIIPMLPLLRSPLFVAMRRQKQLRLQTERSPHSLAQQSGESTSSGATESSPLLYPSPSTAQAASSSASRNLRVFFDIPPLEFSSNRRVQNGATAETEGGSSKRRQFRLYCCLLLERNFLLVTFSSLVFMFSTAVPDNFSVMQAGDLLPKQKASTSRITVVYGIFQTLGKLLVSPLADRFPTLFGRTMITLIGATGKGVATALTPVALLFVLRLETFFVLNAVYGVFDGIQYGIFSPLVLNLVGSELFGTALSFITAISGLPIVAGAPLAGFVYDLIHDYSLPFGVAGLVIIISSVFLLCVDFSRDALNSASSYRRPETKRENTHEQCSTSAASSASAISPTNSSASDYKQLA